MTARLRSKDHQHHQLLKILRWVSLSLCHNSWTSFNITAYQINSSKLKLNVLFVIYTRLVFFKIRWSCKSQWGVLTGGRRCWASSTSAPKKSSRQSCPGSPIVDWPSYRYFTSTVVQRNAKAKVIWALRYTDTPSPFPFYFIPHKNWLSQAHSLKSFLFQLRVTKGRARKADLIQVLFVLVFFVWNFIEGDATGISSY